MIQLSDFHEDFCIKIEEEPQTRKAWFDKIERRFIDEEEMKRIYGAETLDEDCLRKDMYIPIPVLHEREVIKTFLREISMEYLIERYNGLQTKDDRADFLNYSDEKGPWLHDIYFTYARQCRLDFVNNWIHDNRIDNAVYWFPISLREEQWGFSERWKRAKKLMEEDEEFYKKSSIYRRMEDNTVVCLEPEYKRYLPK